MSETHTGDQAAAQPPATPTPKPTGKTAAAKPKANPGGSTSRVRAELLLALGVLKVVNANQMWRLLRPAAKGNKFARAALGDLAKAGLVLSEGSTEDALKTWRLTPAGAVAAEQVLPTGRQVGSLAKGAGLHGAAHAMAVNDTVIAFVRGGREPDGAGAIGSITSWHTEYPIEPRPGLKVRPDAVLRAPEHRLPVLLVEVDRHTEHRPVLAAKFPRYAAAFAHRAKVPDPDSRSGATRAVPAWRQLFPDPVRDGYPPVAVVFADNASQAVTRNRMKELHDATRPQWEGDTRHQDYTDYSRAIPIIVTTLGLLQRHGPLAPVWWRFGHTGRQTLHQALANPDDAAARRRERRARQEAAQRAEQEAERRREEAGREASRCPVCHRAADRYEDPDDAADGRFPCQPCIRAQQQADEQAALREIEQAVAAASEFLREWTENTAPCRVLARQARAWGQELRAAWNARHSAAQRPTQSARPALPALRAPQPGPVTPAARTALQQLLAQLEDERARHHPAPDPQPAPADRKERRQQARETRDGRREDQWD